MNRIKDRAFNLVIREQIETVMANERVLFIDTDNQVREAVYPAEFQSGELRRIRERLEKEGVLKAIVYVSAYVFGAPKQHGTRTSVVEYLPDGGFYGYTYSPSRMTVADDDAFEIALGATKSLFAYEEGEEWNE